VAVIAGITIVGDEIRIDTSALYYLHDVDRDPDPELAECPVCGDAGNGVPCDIVELVDRLEEALKPWRDKTTAPDGAGIEKE
jgi:hypothetical protein